MKTAKVIGLESFCLYGIINHLKTEKLGLNFLLNIRYVTLTVATPLNY